MRSMFSVKEATVTNDNLRQVVIQQKTVISDQLSRITELQQDLSSTRSSLSQLRAERDYHDMDTDQLISTLRLQLQAVSRCPTLMELGIVILHVEFLTINCFQRSSAYFGSGSDPILLLIFLFLWFLLGRLLQTKYKAVLFQIDWDKIRQDCSSSKYALDF